MSMERSIPPHQCKEYLEAYSITVRSTWRPTPSCWGVLGDLLCYGTEYLNDLLHHGMEYLETYHIAENIECISHSFKFPSYPYYFRKRGKPINNRVIWGKIENVFSCNTIVNVVRIRTRVITPDKLKLALLLLAGTNWAGRDGDQVQGQDPSPPEEGGALQLEEDREDRHQIPQETRHQWRWSQVCCPPTPLRSCSFFLSYKNYLRHTARVSKSVRTTDCVTFYLSPLTQSAVRTLYERQAVPDQSWVQELTY